MPDDLHAAHGFAQEGIDVLRETLTSLLERRGDLWPISAVKLKQRWQQYLPWLKDILADFEAYHQALVPQQVSLINFLTHIQQQMQTHDTYCRLSLNLLLPVTYVCTQAFAVHTHCRLFLDLVTAWMMMLRLTRLIRCVWHSNLLVQS